MQRTLLSISMVIALAGCGPKEPEPTASTPTTTDEAVQAADPNAAPAPPSDAPVAIPESKDGAKADAGAPPPAVDLEGLTIQLRAWMMNKRTGIPKDFAAWAAANNIQAPPPPPGKKYAISKRAWVILVDK